MRLISSIKELQNIEINVLREFVGFCSQNKLEYFAMYGTLLGAVRDGDIIPWDDDIDICMPRKDYERFIELTKKNGINEYVKIYNPIDNISGEDIDVATIVRAYDNRTIITSGDFTGIGVYIDIHPLDLFPDSKWVKQLWFIWIKLHNKGMRLAMVKMRSIYVTRFLLKMTLLPIILIAKLFGFRYFKKMILKSAAYFSHRYPYSKECGSILATWPIGQMSIDKKEFYEIKYKKFNSITIRVPGNYEKLLTSWYGDYRIPKEERWHNIVAFWL